MIDPASLQNWIDNPPSPPPLPFGPTASETEEIDKALDTLAAAIRRAEGGERKSMANYLMRLPTVSRTAKILAQLPSSQLMAFLERHRADNGVADALMPSISASRTADRMAQANLFRRVMMAPRMYALKRACDAAAQIRWSLSHEHRPNPPRRRRAGVCLAGHRPDDRQRSVHDDHPERSQRRHIARQRRRHRHPKAAERQELHLPRQFLQRRGFERRRQSPQPDDPLELHREPDLQQADPGLEPDDRQGSMRHHLTGFQMGFLGGSSLGGGLSCPKISFGGGGPTIMSIGVGPTNSGKLTVTGNAVAPTGYTITSLLGLF